MIELRPGNEINYDFDGRYGVCDFDGDGVDDLFLATGRTWWFSSYGEFPWSFLAARTEKLEQVKLGYFDNDNKCDVLTESGPEWVISSGGRKWWTSIGTFDTRLKDVAFGQFDPNHRDHRPGVTRQSTHAFRRLSTGQWQISPLAAPAWQTVGGSSYQMSKLRFGDFTGDGVTDVLASDGGRWAISDAARGTWTRLNRYLNDTVSSLFIADLNNNNIDDLLKLKVNLVALQPGSVRLTYKWYISDDGRSRWRELKSYTWTHNGFHEEGDRDHHAHAKPGQEPAVEESQRCDLTSIAAAANSTLRESTAAAWAQIVEREQVRHLSDGPRAGDIVDGCSLNLIAGMK